MLNHSWLILPAFIWFCCCCLNLGTYGQSENAIGAHRVFEKTSFSCSGRPAGYYADIETGCQVYHMCDGLGRQFSYSCPNTTLFQQRMLICDHWYMVNCSKAESDYAANLLIGQRDKPFVNDGEQNLRTPRPDLLDRPYAPDYSGESFRNQYKKLPALQNRILDNDAHKSTEKLQQTANPTGQVAGQQRWKILQPSRTVLPPAFEAQVESEAITTTPRVQSKVPTTPTSTTFYYSSSSSRATLTPTTTTITTTRATNRPLQGSRTQQLQQQQKQYQQQKQQQQQQQQLNTFSNAALHQRHQEVSLHADNDDLGTSHSTRYNTSADFNSAELDNKISSPQRPIPASTVKPININSPTSVPTTPKIPGKIPSRIYEPPFLYPIYNENETSSTKMPLQLSSATPFTTRASTTRSSSIFSSSTISTTSRPPNRPTTVAGKPFTAAPTAATATSKGRKKINANIFQQNQRFSNEPRTPAPAQGFKPPTPLPPVNSAKTLKPPALQKAETSVLDYNVPTTSRLKLPTPFIDSPSNFLKSEPPPQDLLPPFPEFVQHDVATTQGPPIYYEWKIPSNGLEPPKLDPPIGVDGREYPDSLIDYNSISGQGSSSPLVNTFSIDQGGIVNRNTNSNSNSFAQNPVSSRTPTSRSIKEGAAPKNSISQPVTKSDDSAPTTESKNPADITQLRKDYSIPEYAFPLENIGRTGYLATDTYNSFQLKIPERRSDTDEKLNWFGENPKCPECHPSYVIPGTCAPCIRR